MTYKQSALLAIRRREMSAFLLGARIAVACAAFLLVCLVAQQVFGVDLGGAVGTAILALPLLALFFVLYETGPLAARKRPKFAPRFVKNGPNHSQLDPDTFEPGNTNKPPRRRPRR